MGKFLTKEEDIMFSLAVKAREKIKNGDSMNNIKSYIIKKIPNEYNRRDKIEKMVKKIIKFAEEDIEK